MFWHQYKTYIKQLKLFVVRNKLELIILTLLVLIVTYVIYKFGKNLLKADFYYICLFKFLIFFEDFFSCEKSSTNRPSYIMLTFEKKNFYKNYEEGILTPFWFSTLMLFVFISIVILLVHFNLLYANDYNKKNSKIANFNSTVKIFITNMKPKNLIKFIINKMCSKICLRNL